MSVGLADQAWPQARHALRDWELHREDVFPSCTTSLKNQIPQMLSLELQSV